MLLVGSAALRYWFPREARTGTKWDLWSSPEEFERWWSAGAGVPRLSDDPVVSQLGERTYRVIQVKPGSSESLFIDANAQSDCLPGTAQPIRVAQPSSLLLIKRSHLHRVPQWYKHITDYHFLKARVREGDITAAERSAYEKRRAEVAACFPDREPSMRVPNEVFFARYKHRSVRLYEHDDLHRATCHYHTPLYQQLKTDRRLAYVPKRTFEQLSPADKVRLVQEECYAIALERIVLPARELGVEYCARRAFLHALHRICTDLTQGWFRDFAVEHYPDVLKDDTDFVGRFDAAVRRGLIRRQAPSPLPADARAALEAQLTRVAQRDRKPGCLGCPAMQ